MPQPPLADIWPLPNKIFGKGDPDFDYQLRKALEHIERHGPHTSGPSGWDAIVDASLAASDPASRQFKGIGEALTYLQGLGLVRCNVYVRPYEGYYDEPGTWSAPAGVMLFGGGTHTPLYVGAGGVFWRHNAHLCSTGMTSVVCQNMLVEFGAKTWAFRSGTQQVLFVHCVLNNLSAGPTSGFVSSSVANPAAYINCLLSGGLIQPLGGNVYILGCDIDMHSSGSVNIAGSGPANALHAYGLAVVGSSGGSTWGLPPITDLVLSHSTSRGGSHVTGQLTLQRTSSSVALHIDSKGRTTNVNVIISGGPHPDVDIRGGFQNLTIAECAALGIDAQCTGIVDITGPGVIDLACEPQGDSIVCKLRGDALSGHIAAVDARTSGVFLQLIAARFCNIQAALDGVGASGTRKSYALDAASTKNIVDVAGDTTYPVAGTDLGAANLVRVT